ncbi:MAG: lysylphosphatidylglycerol synthase transmembrane domain-containing protein [Nocardioidaceae bacterium]
MSAEVDVQGSVVPRTRRGIPRWAKSVASGALVLVLLGGVLPMVSHINWGDIRAALDVLSLKEILLLAVIWLMGLYAYSFVLTAAMPPLSRRRALTLNLTGSAVSNLVPCGGALGMGLNFAMTRAWGYSRAAFLLYTFVTNLWNILVKLSLPALALGLLVLSGDVAQPQLATVALIAMATFVVLIGFVIGALSSERVATLVGRGASALATLAMRIVRSRRSFDLTPAVLQLRNETIGLLRRGWAQLSLAMIAYSVLQALLLYSCLHMLGTSLTAYQIFAGYAVERALTVAVITPGGAGLVEVGVTALLIAFGGDPAATVAGVLLYRAFTFGLEIPVGGAGLLVWLWSRRGSQPATAQD